MTSVLGITLSEAQENYRKYTEIEMLIAKNQRYKIDDKELERASLKDVSELKAYWEKMCYKLSYGRGAKAVSVNLING